MSATAITSIAADSVVIDIVPTRTFTDEDGQFVRMFSARYNASGAEYCEIGVYPDGAVHSSISKHSDETAARLCSALARRLGINK